MDTTCLNNLVGLKSLCASGSPQPLFYLDDIEGMTQQCLTDLATSRDGSGSALATFLIQSAIRLLLADIDSVMPSNYRIKQVLSSVCSTCTFSGFFSNASVAGTGIMVQNNSMSRFSSMIVDSLQVSVNTTGTFTLRIQDTAGLTKDITQDFVAGQVLTLQNVAYETTAKQLQIFFTDPTVQLFTISCPTGSTCGCGGAQKSLGNDLIIGGYVNGMSAATQYGILPCIKIRCSYDGIICDLVQGSPRLFALALLYLVASKAFDENALSQRVNRTASVDKEERQSLSEYYYQLYRERLTGNPKKGILGIASAVNSNLKLIKDTCVTCDNPLGIAWATG